MPLLIDRLLLNTYRSMIILDTSIAMKDFVVNRMLLDAVAVNMAISWTYSYSRSSTNMIRFLAIIFVTSKPISKVV